MGMLCIQDNLLEWFWQNLNLKQKLVRHWVAVQYEKDEKKAIVSVVDQIVDDEKQAAGLMALKNELSCDEDIEALLKADKYDINEIVKIGTQKHLFMESHAAYVVPDEERRLMVYTGTQFLDSITYSCWLVYVWDFKWIK